MFDMNIYTSYFGNLKILEKNNIVPIGICCYPPKWFKGPNITAIAPSPDILENCKSNHQIYRQRYNDEILSLFKDPKIFVDRLQHISDGKDVALCCFEKPGEFCHRHILAEWLNDKLGLNVSEYEKTEEVIVNPLF